MEWNASPKHDRDSESANCRVDVKAFSQSARVISPKGIRMPAQGKRVFERRPGFRLRGIACALKGHGNVMIAIRVKQFMRKLCIDGSIALSGQIRFFLIGDPGRRSRTSLPGLISAPLSGERVGRDTRNGERSRVDLIVFCFGGLSGERDGAVIGKSGPG